MPTNAKEQMIRPNTESKKHTINSGLFLNMAEIYRIFERGTHVNALQTF